ncbi:MAG: DUF892 family protein [Terriglobales bacterium]
MGKKAKGQKCKAMEGLMKEGNEVIEEDMEDGVKDAALIAVAQRVEHYEMAGYGCVRTYASLLGDTNAAALLEKTLEEEKETDEVLGGIAEEINVEIPRAQNQRAQSTGNRDSQRSKAAARYVEVGAMGKDAFVRFVLFSRWRTATGFSIRLYRVIRIVIHCATI